MRRPAPTAATLLGVAAWALLVATSAVRAAEHTVDIVDFGYEPAQVEVAVGDTITWTNTGADAHTVTSADGELDSGTLGAGESFEHVFQTAGTYAYICDFHPNRMRATVVVGGGGGAPVAPPATGDPTGIVLILAGVLVVAAVAVVGLRMRARRNA